MFILKLIRYLRGYVQFTAQGVFIERFLNLIARDRISVWDGRKRGDKYTGYVSAASYGKMRRHTKKAGVRIRVADKEGAPFHRRKYRKRGGLLLGLGLFAVFLVAMSGFIWRIEIHGNETVTEDRIVSALEDLGIKPGALRMSINVRDAERKTMLAFQELSWVALNMDGSVIRVEVTERIQPPLMIDPNVPCNIVADRAGQILNMQIYDGQPLVQKGDVVLPGDVIVSGIMEDRLGKNLFRHAFADITAEVQQTLRLDVPLQQVEYVATGEVMKRNYLQMFSLEMPVFFPRAVPAPFKVDRASTPVKLFAFELPMVRLEETYQLMEEVPITYTEEQAKELALRELTAMEKAEFGDGEIIQREVTAVLESSVFSVRADYVVHMKIGNEVEIFKEAVQ